MCNDTDSRALSMKTVHLTRMMHIMHEERMREFDPSAAPGRVIAFLRLTGEVTVGDMCMILGTKPRSLEKSLSKLVEEGLVSRQEGEKKWLDKVKLTEKGLEPGKMPKGPMSKVFDTLSEEERGQFAAILDKLNAGFEKELGLPEDPEERRKAVRDKSATFHHGPVHCRGAPGPRPGH